MYLYVPFTTPTPKDFGITKVLLELFRMDMYENQRKLKSQNSIR